MYVPEVDDFSGVEGFREVRGRSASEESEAAEREMRGEGPGGMRLPESVREAVRARRAEAKAEAEELLSRLGAERELSVDGKARQDRHDGEVDGRSTKRFQRLRLRDVEVERWIEEVGEEFARQRSVRWLWRRWR